MKFTRSQRQLHQHNYNPPCNVYQASLTHASSNKILTGSLAPPTSLLSLTQKNTFGYSPRFPNQNRSNSMKKIGPGSYEHEIIKAKILIPNEKDKSKIVKGKFIQSGESPSIPYSYYGQNPDEEQLEYVKQLQMNINLGQSHKKTTKTAAKYTFPKSKKQPGYLKAPAQGDNQNVIEEQSNQLESDHIDLKKINAVNEKTAIVWQQKIKKANHKRLEIIQNISPDYIPSLQLIEIMKKRRSKENPGPADYNPEGPNQIVFAKKNKNSKLTNQGITTNLAEDDLEEYEYYEVGGVKKGVSFTTGRRFEEYDKNNWSEIGPGHYSIKQSNFHSNSSQKYSFARGDRKVFEPQGEGEFRFYIDADYGNSTLSQLNKTDKNIKMPYKTALHSKPDTGTHFVTKTRSESCPFGSSAIRFPEKKEDGLQLTLQEEREIKNRQKFNKMIRTRMILHKKLGTDRSEKEEGLLGISTMASTID